MPPVLWRQKTEKDTPPENEVPESQHSRPLTVEAGFKENTMTHDDLKTIINTCNLEPNDVRFILAALTEISRLQTEAITTFAGSGDDAVQAAVRKLVAHAAPKPTYTTADIKAKQHRDGYYCVTCGRMWFRREGGWGSYDTEKTARFDSRAIAELVAAGLRATNNIPKG